MFLKDLVAGGISSAIVDTIVAPIERVKLLLQVQHANPDITNRYTGILDCFRRIPKEQGILSFWRGNQITLLRGIPIQAFNFAFKDHLRVFLLEDVDENTNFWRFIWGNLAAGGGAGVISISLVYPLDFARTRLAADVGRSRETREFSGLVDCIKKTLERDGIRGIFRGYGISVISVALYRAIYFGAYDSAKEIFTVETHGTVPFYLKWFMAQSSVAIAGQLSYPFDTVRRRLMMQSGRKVKKYNNARHCFIKMWQEEGIWAFYKGATANLWRSAGGGLLLVLYDEIKEYLK